MGHSRLRRFDGYSLPVLIGALAVFFVVIWGVDRGLSKQQEQLQLELERDQWLQRLLQVEGQIVESWRWLSALGASESPTISSLFSHHDVIDTLWPGAVQLALNPKVGAWQMQPAQVQPQFRAAIPQAASCADVADLDWLATATDVYRVLLVASDPSGTACRANLLPMAGYLTQKLMGASAPGWLLLTPDGAQLSGGGDAALIALQAREQLSRTEAGIVELHTGNSQPYLLMQFDLLGLASQSQAVTLYLAKPVTELAETVLHRNRQRQLLWFASFAVAALLVALTVVGGRRVNRKNSTSSAGFGMASGLFSRSNTSRLELALESSQSGYWEWDVAANAVEFSEHWKKMLGLNPEECRAGGIEEWLRRIHPDDRDNSRELLVAHLKGHTGMFEHEQRLLDQAGNYVWFLTRGKVTERDEQGKALYVVGVYTRVDERKRVNELVLKQQKALRQLNEVATLSDSEPLEQLRKSLSLGAAYLSLPMGIISHIDGDVYTVKVQHSPPNAIKDGQVFDLPNCYCSDTLKKGDVLALHHVEQSELANHPCYITTHLETYIGAPIWVSGRVYGTLNFSGPVARVEPFSEAERDFVRLMARWVGATLERWIRARENIRLTETFTKLSDSLPGCLCQFQMRPDGTSFFPYVSRGVRDVYGVTPAEVANTAEPVLERIHPEDVERVTQSIDKSAKSLCLWSDVYRYHHPDKGVIWVRGQTSPEKLADGSVIWHGFLWDVSDEIKAQEHLKYSNRWRQAILDAASVSFIATDREGIIRTFNSGAESMLGYRAEEVVNLRDPSFLHLPEEVIARAELLSQELGYRVEPGFDVFIEKVKHGGTDEWEWTYVRKDGSHVPIVLTVTAVYDEHGKVDGYLGVGRDVSVVKEQKEQLRAFAERTQTLLDNAADGIVAIRQDGTIDTFNKSAERLFGWSADEAVGQSVNILMPRDLSIIHDGYLTRSRRSRVERVLGQSRELSGVRRSGEEFPLEIALSEIIQDGEPLYIAMVRDITERKRVDRMKSEFIATVSHELRTPLTAISGSLRLLDSGAMGALPDQLERLVHIAYSNSSRLIMLVNDLLDMEKLVAGKMQFAMRRQSLMPLVVSAMEENSSFAREYEVEAAEKLQKIGVF